MLATTAISLFDPEAWTADRVRFPWAIAAAAKASIVASNEHRRPGATGKDVLQICALYNALETPLADDPGDSSESVGAFFVRTSYEQFRYQQSHFEEISRFAALFEGIDDLDTEVLDAALIKRLLGCSLGEFIVAGFVLLPVRKPATAISTQSGQRSVTVGMRSIHTSRWTSCAMSFAIIFLRHLSRSATSRRRPSSQMFVCDITSSTLLWHLHL